MTEMDQDNSPDKDDSEFDDELDSLSSDEKAAFEKIMAEISAATGTPQEASSAPAKEAKPKEAPASAEAKDEAPSPIGTDTSNPDMDEEPSPADKTENSATVLEKASTDDPPDEDEEPLDEEQQAALDAIMAEIEGKSGGSNRDPDSSPQHDGDEEAAKSPEDSAIEEAPATQEELDDEELSDDQQEALDAIMNEINSKRGGDADTKEAPVEAENKDDEELSDDQQEALDAIMAEINSKRGGDADTKEAPAEEENKDDEELSDDQQEALDAIMAEINSKRGGDAGTKEAPAEEENKDDEELSDDQQEALNAIMAEINSKRGGDVDTKEAPAEEEKQEESEKSNLTIEEFDDELNNLLTEAEPAEKPTTKSPAAPSTGKAASPTEEPPEEAPEAAAEKAYPILQEVPVAENKVRTSKNKTAGRTPFLTRGKRRLLTASLAACLIVCGGYYAYRYFMTSEAPSTVASERGQIDQPAVQAAAGETSPSLQAVRADESGTDEAGEATLIAPTHPETLPTVSAQEEGFSSLKQRLFAAREQIQAKITDINQLKSYYARGIEEEKEKIEQSLEQGRIPSFNEAMGSKGIELALRAIQRRKTYIAKLGTPISQLSDMAEELLYLERRTDVIETLANGINGLPIQSFENEATAIVTGYLQYNTQLSIDQVEAAPIELSSIWDDIASEISQKSNLLAQRAPLNRAISKEICIGNYERKYLLTALSAQTATCLVRWPGKDLYLNAVNELTPEVANVLSQWPGESISLNGIKELSAESAKHLASWPGKRLSLNGLTHLSPQATTHLSQWQGEQLEMVGLHTIGPWENYGTRLFLSEKLRRQLEEQ